LGQQPPPQQQQQQQAGPAYSNGSTQHTRMGAQQGGGQSEEDGTTGAGSGAMQGVSACQAVRVADLLLPTTRLLYRTCLEYLARHFREVSAPAPLAAVPVSQSGVPAGSGSSHIKVKQLPPCDIRGQGGGGAGRGSEESVAAVSGAAGATHQQQILGGLSNIQGAVQGCGVANSTVQRSNGSHPQLLLPPLSTSTTTSSAPDQSQKPTDQQQQHLPGTSPTGGSTPITTTPTHAHSHHHHHQQQQHDLHPPYRHRRTTSLGAFLSAAAAPAEQPHVTEFEQLPAPILSDLLAQSSIAVGEVSLLAGRGRRCNVGAIGIAWQEDKVGRRRNRAQQPPRVWWLPGSGHISGREQSGAHNSCDTQPLSLVWLQSCCVHATTVTLVACHY
jgi:hypothetical protein